MFIKKIVSSVSLVALVAVFGVNDAQAINSAGNLQVSAQVIGQKPVVQSIAPDSAVNTGAQAVVITGYNFEDVPYIYVSFDDDNSTMLTGVAVTDTDPDSVDGDPEEITATVPAGITPGIYNVYVTTEHGTNISGVKFTVTAPNPANIPTIVGVTPTGPIVTVSTGSSTQTFSVTSSDLNDPSLDWTAVATDGSFSVVAGSVAMDGVTHEGTFSTTYTAPAVENLAITATFAVDDAAGNNDGADSQNVTIYAIEW